MVIRYSRTASGHQVFAHRFGEVTQFFIIAEAELGVFSLGQLALGAGGFVHLHQHSVVAVYRQFPAQLLEQLHVDGQRTDPLLASHDVGGAHQVVVHHVRKVIRGQTGLLEDDHILFVLRHGDVAADSVGHMEVFRRVTGGTQSHNRYLPCRQLRLDLLVGQIAALRILSVDARVYLVRFLHGADLCDLLFRHEAGVGLAFRYEFLNESLVDRAALTLPVGAVRARLAVRRRAFVEADAEVVQRVDQHGNGAFDFALVVRILDAQERHAAAAVGQTLIREGAVQIAQVDKTGGAGTHTGDHGTFRQIALGISCFQFFGRGRNVGEQQFRQLGIVHMF